MSRELCTMNVRHSELAKEPLIDLWNDLDERDQNLCKDMFGRLTDLIHVPVNWNLIKAIAWFWDDDRRCFVINDNDYSPLVEEYEAIFQGNSVKCRKAYAPFKRRTQLRSWPSI
jgi:hypothetical protein